MVREKSTESGALHHKMYKSANELQPKGAPNWTDSVPPEEGEALPKASGNSVRHRRKVVSQ